MIWKNKVNQLAVAIAFAAGTVHVAEAQQTASAIGGTVTSDNGAAIFGAIIEVVNEQTGLRRTTSTNDDGEFSLPNLPVGSGYTIVIRKSGYSPQRTEDIVVQLGSDAELSISLTQSTSDEVVVVQASQITSYAALGPSRSFNLNDLQTKPAINRNITDIIRIDPRIFVDEGSNNQIQCGGKNNRFNSFTLDGVRINDSFGLNNNGYPTERVPFSFDSINQVSVELAPFDAEYGGFTACNINAVTKSGTNELTGSVFIDYTDESLQGDSLEGTSLDIEPFDETRYGFNVGFPLVKDKLFAHVTYEVEDGADLFSRGPVGSNTAVPVDVTQAELDEIADIASELYLYDVAEVPSSQSYDEEKLLIKLDWNITDAQRLAFTYIYNDGNTFTGADGDNNEYEFFNHFYERGTELESYVTSWFADWTSSFSTEVRVSYSDVDNRQLSLNGTDFGEIRVELTDRDGLEDVDVYLGSDDSRQANDLNYDQLSLSFTGQYDAGDHLISFGIEREDLSVFNLFVQHTETEIRFDGIDNFREGFADAIYYNNAPSGDPNDAAAEWGYAINTLFAQDEFSIGDLTILAGLRYDWYETSDKPEENADFVADYGFSNSTNLDGEGLLQPRIGLTYQASDSLTLRGGLGLYTGGNPNVWLSNNFSNNNVLQFGARGRDFFFTDGTRSLFDDDVTYEAIEANAPIGAGAGWGVPTELFNAVAAGDGSNFEINYLDPDFKLPSEWKFSVGADFETESGYFVTTDLLITKSQNTAITLRGDLEQVGTNDDGYPIYDSVREASFVLTNSSVGDESAVLSIGVSKEYDNGIDWTLGYAYTQSKDVQPMTSSVAFSNYQNRAFFDPQEEVLSTSNYEIPHRITGTFSFSRAFFGNYETNISTFGLIQQGSPYSIVSSDEPNDIYGFTPFLEGNNVLAPGGERNAEAGPWWAKVDLRVSQELPGILDGHSASAFITVNNFTNLLNDEWGVLREASFPATVLPDDETPVSTSANASLYEIRLGVRYNF